MPVLLWFYHVTDNTLPDLSKRSYNLSIFYAQYYSGPKGAPRGQNSSIAEKAMRGNVLAVAAGEVQSATGNNGALLLGPSSRPSSRPLAPYCKLQPLHVSFALLRGFLATICHSSRTCMPLGPDRKYFQQPSHPRHKLLDHSPSVKGYIPLGPKPHTTQQFLTD